MLQHNPVKAIRAKCLDCCCGQTKEVALCASSNCPLYPFRFGKNPYRSKREYTEEQRAAMAERMKRNRGAATVAAKETDQPEIYLWDEQSAQAIADEQKVITA